jgi:protein SCO1
MAAPFSLAIRQMIVMFSNISLRQITAAASAIAAVAGTTVAFTLHHAPPATAAAQLQIGGHFELSTPDGRAVTEATFRGKWLLVYFGYTFCPDVCPATLMSIAQGLKKLGPRADKVQPIFITVDPERDTPELIGQYVKDFDERFVGLSGSPQQIAAAARNFHVYYAVRKLGNNEYVVDHSSFIYVIDPNGTFVRLLSADLPGHEVADQLAQLIDQGGQR